MKLLRSPALHMLVLGGLLFGAMSSLGDWGSFRDQPRIVVAKHRLDLTLKTFAQENGRTPSQAEIHAILDELIDQEVLFQYALELGMYEHPAAQRRLAQIAEFVESNPHDARPEPERAQEAMELGLHNGDLIVRRVMIDSARRLIRAVVLLQEPTPQLMNDYLQSNRDLFMRPARSRISHVTVNGFRWSDTEARAGELLRRIQAEGLSADSASALGDEPVVAPHLPALTQKALTTKFGMEFASAVVDQPVGVWVGPIASRYGHHLVYVHEHQPAYLPLMDDIRDRVKERLMDKLADEWLALRLRELRLQYVIVAPPVPT